MTIVTGSECVEITTYVAHTDGLKNAAPIRAGERRHHCRMEGVVTGLKLIGPHPGNYRDWLLEGLFEMTHAGTGGMSQASRMYNRDRKFFISVKDLLKTGKAVEFLYEFYVERLAEGGGLKEQIEVTSLSALEASGLRIKLLSRLQCVFNSSDSP
jgi:hypothetical protein